MKKYNKKGKLIKINIYKNNGKIINFINGYNKF
ncbi:DUF2963 domain-containing protein [Candidatus Phytoplasma pini]